MQAKEDIYNTAFQKAREIYDNMLPDFGRFVEEGINKWVSEQQAPLQGEKTLYRDRRRAEEKRLVHDYRSMEKDAYQKAKAVYVRTLNELKEMQVKLTEGNIRKFSFEILRPEFETKAYLTTRQVARCWYEFRKETLTYAETRNVIHIMVAMNLVSIMIPDYDKRLRVVIPKVNPKESGIID